MASIVEKLTRRMRRLRSDALDVVKSIDTLESVDDAMKDDIMRLIDGFSMVGSDRRVRPVRSLALDHPDLAVDIAWASSRVDLLVERQSASVTEQWDLALLAAEQHLLDTEDKPSKARIEAFARTSEGWQEERRKLEEIQMLKSFLEHLRWELRSRVQMIQILDSDAKRDKDLGYLD